MINKEHIDRILAGGGNVIGQDGAKIGGVGQVYLDDESGQPSFVTVKTGLFGTSESFVPLEGGNLDGDDIVVPYSKDQVKDAPRIDAEGHLEPSEQDQLYEYYQLGGQTQATSGRTENVTEDVGTEGVGTEGVGTEGVGAGTAARDTSGRESDDAMTRSEERVRVGKEQQEVGRARLRKYVVTENVTQTVPVSREEVRIEREPITDANRDAAMGGPELSEGEHEVTLSEERPVVDKETVPVERVRLEKDSVGGEETVDEEVRKERIESEGTTDDR